MLSVSFGSENPGNTSISPQFTGSTKEQASTQILLEAQSDQKNSTSKGSLEDSGSVSFSNHETRKVLHQDIEFQPPLPGVHVNSMGSGMSSCHVAERIPVSGNFHPIQMRAANENLRARGTIRAPTFRSLIRIFCVILRTE